jgi:hypothetical protein
VCPSDASHISQLSLRQAVLFPQIAKAATEADGKRDCHFYIVAGIVASTIRFGEQ